MDHLKPYKLFEGRKESQTFPSEEFAEATGIKWVTKDWKLPDNINSDEAASFVKTCFDGLSKKSVAEKSAEDLINFYHKLLSLNTELKGLD